MATPNRFDPPRVDVLARARAAAAMSSAPTATPRHAAPPDPGEVLAEMPRGEREVLRVALREFEGKPFVTIAVWEKGTGGAFWPARGKAVTVRVRELGAVLEALVVAAERLAAGGAP